ncbi:peptide methionine sulfoxide reductase MsrB isoform X3 [Cryptotermes secundus]|uniref:peptide methionine sulfoxide reductase MsrB isoform X3 n=1 Tax=Cryptotermes secundus TaxID=105785 RepID=UPI000CD7B15B|nr:peptide methionine sulfoxide reductase MsrB isoform X3 [Cryptotermes secundus]
MSDSAKDQNGKAELKKRLTPMQYHVTQEKGTERAFTGKYYKTKDAGLYTCVVCGEELFSSETKFDSGCGWPAFNDVLDQGKRKKSNGVKSGERVGEVIGPPRPIHVARDFIQILTDDISAVCQGTIILEPHFAMDFQRHRFQQLGSLFTWLLKGKRPVTK